MTFIRFGGFRRALGLAPFLAFAAGAGVLAVYLSFFMSLPDLRRIEDYRPPVTSRVLDREGRLIGEFFVERRQVVPLEEIPRHAQLAFVAAEDSAFFEHAGIDYVSILRAAWVDLTAGQIKQGASTITMQLVKQLLLSPERHFRRKIREMILARRIEQHFSKQEILFLYLNHIYFGHGAHGIAEAAYSYFGKEVSELTLSESALLAGLPQRPSSYSPFRNPEAAEKRRRYVLRRMFDEGMIDQDTYQATLANPPEPTPPVERGYFAAASYFTEEVRRYLFGRLGGERVLHDGLVIETTIDLDLQRAASRAVREGLEDHDKRQGYRGPLRQVAEEEIEAELEKLAEENDLADLLQGNADETASDEGGGFFAWLFGRNDKSEESEEAPSEDALTELADDAEAPETTAETALEVELAEAASAAIELPFDEVLLGVVLEVDNGQQRARVGFAPGVEGRVELPDVAWAREANPARRPAPVKKISKIFEVGDVAPFVRMKEGEGEDEAAPLERETGTPPRFGLHQEPVVQGALLSIEIASGDVLALVGGYDFEKSQFNRATQAKRQPGSAFKPVIYGAALSRGYTPVAILYDRPVVYQDPISGFVWRPQNYSRHFYGPLPMRTALARSVNNATVHLFRDLGVDYVVDYARKLGIESPLNRDLSLALGSSDVSLLELTRAYAIFPNRGRRVIPRFIRRVTDRHGEVLLENVLLGEEPGDASEPEVAPLPPMQPPETHLGASEGELGGDENGERVPEDQVLPAAEAYLMCDLLKAVVRDPRGTAWRLKSLGRHLAGKTGTTNDQADAWFIGFSPDITTGVWVGHDEIHLLGWGETGSRAAAPIWVNFMEVALADRPIRDFEEPTNIVFQKIDRSTGLLADARSEDAYIQPFILGTEPTESVSTATSATDARRALRQDSF